MRALRLILWLLALLSFVLVVLKVTLGPLGQIELLGLGLLALTLAQAIIADWPATAP